LIQSSFSLRLSNSASSAIIVEGQLTIDIYV